MDVKVKKGDLVAWSEFTITDSKGAEIVLKRGDAASLVKLLFTILRIEKNMDPDVCRHTACQFRVLDAEESVKNLKDSTDELYVELCDTDEQICSMCKRLNPQHRDCTTCEERESRLAAIAKAEGR